MTYVKQLLPDLPKCQHYKAGVTQSFEITSNFLNSVQNLFL